MYEPDFWLDRYGVPILSKYQLDLIAEDFISDFYPEALKSPREIDVDSFAQNYLGLIQDYAYLSHNGVYLGMMVFNDTDGIIVYEPDTNGIKCISADARTMIIDNQLLEDRQECRYRFTVLHECGHDIFHRGYYSQVPNQLSLFNNYGQPTVKCRSINIGGNKKATKEWTKDDTMEWQANYFAAALLLPRSMVIKAVQEEHERYKNLRNNFFNKDSVTINSIAKIFNASEEATRYRLEGLELIGNSEQLHI